MATLEFKVDIISGGVRPRFLGSKWVPCRVLEEITDAHGLKTYRVELPEGAQVSLRRGKKSFNRVIYKRGHQVIARPREIRGAEFCAVCNRLMEEPFIVYEGDKFIEGSLRTRRTKAAWCKECHDVHEARAKKQRALLDEAQKYMAAGDYDRAMEIIEESNRV